MKKLLTAIILLVASIRYSQATACPTTYTNTFQLTIPAQSTLSGTLTNYPAPFVGSSQLAVTGSGGFSQSSGTDIVFCTATSGGTIVPFELVAGTYVSTTGAGVWWILNPTVSNTTASIIYVMVGKASAVSYSNPFTVAGSVSSGTFQVGETLTQATSGVTATLQNISPFTIGNLSAVTSVTTATNTWTGGTSGAIFTPTAIPVTVLWATYLQVHHFGTSSTLTLTDSTGQCVATNHSAIAIAGPTGSGSVGAANFTAASSEYIDTGCISNEQGNGITVKSILNTTAPYPTFYMYVSNGEDSSASGYEMYLGSGTSSAANNFPSMIANETAGSAAFYGAGTPLVNGTWYLVAGTSANIPSTGNMATYINGAAITRTGGAYQTTATVNSTFDMMIGKRASSSNGYYYNGSLAEMQLYSGVQSANLLKADELSWMAPATFYSFSLLTVATPTYSPVAGSYSSAQTVTISTATAGASLVYCIDLTNTCTPSTSYTTPISVALGSYLRAQGTDSGYTSSGISSGFYYSNVPVTYYVSNSGSNSNNGTSTSTPWQTMAAVNAFTFVPGDIIAFNGGQSFVGPLTQTLVGSQGLPIVITSYGTGLATITGANGNSLTLVNSCPYNLSSSGANDGIDLTNSEFVTIYNINITGGGGTAWTGTPPAITIVNSGIGIQETVTRTTGVALRSNIIGPNVNISGFGLDVSFNTRSGSGLVGFNGVSIANNTFKNSLYGAIWNLGYGIECGTIPSITQFENEYIGHNLILNLPGNPTGVTGSIGIFGAEAIDVGVATGITIEDNYINEGGYITGGSGTGGYCSIAVTDSRQAEVLGNEITNTSNTGRFDGCAIDFDANVQNSETAYNLTYNNMGPAFEQGSLGGDTADGNNRIHHNISYNDARGYNSSSTQGAINFWGLNSVCCTLFYNNDVLFVGAGYVGGATLMSFLNSPNSNIIVANNIFQNNAASQPIFFQITSANVTGLLTISNVYDTSGTALLFSSGGATTLAGWQAIGSGYENLNGINYGSTGAANFANLAGFSPPTNGYINNGGLPAVLNFNLLTGSAAIGEGIDPAVLGAALSWRDFHGCSYARTGQLVDAGASAYLQTCNSPSARPVEVY